MPDKILFQRSAAAVLAVVCLLVILAAPMRAQLVISQVYGGGGNSGAPYQNDFIEIFNRGTTPASLGGLSLQYASATGTGNFGATSTQISVLPAVTLQPGQYYLVRESGGSNGVALPTPDWAPSTSINLSGTGGKVALVNSPTTLGCNGGSAPCSPAQVALIIDLVGYGSANYWEGAAAQALTNLSSALRQGGGCTDTNNNANDFVVSEPPVPRNSASALHFCALATNPSGVGGALPANVDPGSTVLLTVTVSPGTNPTSSGLTVTADLTSIGGSSAQALFDDGSNGDASAGDLVFSFLATVSSGTGQGAKTLDVVITDAQGRSANGTIHLTVNPPPPPVVPIRAIQGTGPTSPFAGVLLSTTGIVTAVKTNGFFIQTPKATPPPEGDLDIDPSSEGVFAYTGGAPPADAVVGNLVQVTGTVQEYVPSGYPENLSVTEIAGTVTTKVISTGNPLPAAMTISASDLGTPPDRTQLERLESMLVHVDSMMSVGPTGNTGSKTNGTFYAVISGTARPFREPGMVAAQKPSSMPGIPVFDDNQERLAVDASHVDTSHLPSPLEITSGTTVGNVTGVLDASSFTLLVPSDTELNVGSGMTPVAVRQAGDREFTVATFNLLNFGSSGVTTDRITKAAGVIRDMMHVPDIVGVEEMKDLTTLQALAAAIHDGSQPVYDAYIGTTGGTQRVGLLVKTARVQVTDVTEVGTDAQFYGPTSTDPNVFAWYDTFDRAPLVMHATVTPPVGQAFPITVVVNHLRSLLDLEDKVKGPFARTKRQAGAEWLAAYLNNLQTGGEHIITIGDFNAYEFNDGYVDVLGTILGTPTPAGQAILTSADLVDPNLVDLVNNVDAAQRYSYVEDGNAQAIDHVVVTSNLLARPVDLNYARVDADFPASFFGNTATVARVSDHDPAVAYFTFPSPQADLAVTIVAASTAPLSGHGQSYAITVANSGPDPAANLVFEDTIPANTTFQSLVAPAGWECTKPSIGGTGKVSCTAAALAANASALFTLNIAINCAVANGTTINNLAVVTNDYDDSNMDNNSASATSAVSNPAPVLGAVAVDKPVLSPPNHKLVEVYLDYSLSDNCGAPGVTVAVSSNQPLNGNGDGNTASDWQVIDAHHVLLRAERAPTSAAGRTYTITVTAADALGNTSSGAVNVSVPR